ncbi:MAG: hypothetical protein ASQ68_gp13 [Yellowstone Lake virophage 6]|uniref:hypothetical protein n=1 Tax=Yellowstone Lake virophage 6 TaxID=1557034 RepID=UPI000535DBCD|nr:MAG: hypothetical protein ASQ68_gp13 [Yellowstone Lake virophage 6]AIW01903.1 MAG: hypothetical protein YSLV6_ORF13 [Yellowstone Lake virophage 6]
MNNIFSGTNTFDNNVRLNSTLTDTSGDVGTAGQVLSSTGTGVNWITQSSGSTYINYTASATLPTTTNPTLIVLFSGTTAGQTLTIPTSAYSVGQVIQFKNRASVNVTISSGLSLMFLYASGTSTTVTSYSLAPNDTYNLYWIGFAYVQYTPSNTFSTLASPIYNSATDTTAGTTALTIGSNVITGNIVIGNNTAFNGIISIGGSSVSPNLPNILIGAYNTTLYLVKGFVLTVDTSLGLGQYKAYLNVDDFRTSLYLGNNMTTGSLRLGSSLTTGGTVSIGSVNSETTINGVLIGQNGCLAGRTNYISINTSDLPQTVSTVINTDMFVFLFGSTVGTLNIPVVSNIGQRITVKNTSTQIITLAFPASSVMSFASTTTTTDLSLRSRGLLTLYWAGSYWIQCVPSNELSNLTTSGAITASGGNITAQSGNIIASAGSITASISVLSPIINPSVDTSAGTTALSIGSNVINGNIVIGSALGVGDVSIASAQAIGGTVTIGSSNSETTINGTTKLTGPLNVNSSTGTTDQYLASQGTSLSPIWKTLPASSWVGTATSNLDMGIYNIITTGYLSLGVGSQILCQNNVIPSGSNNQYLSSQGLAGVVWKDIPASTWVSTATSNLNMDTFNIRCNTYRSASATTQLTIGDNLTSTGSAFDVMLGIGTGITSTSAVGIAIGGANTNTRIYGPAVISGALTLGSSITTSGNLNLNSTGLINLNSSSGTTDQYLASQGTSTPIWKTLPASSWVGTATSNLNMGSYSISAPTINGPLTLTGATTSAGITASSGNITTSAGNISSSGTLTAGTGITATTGNITASTGNISTSAGNISSSGTLTAGTGITATTGNITASTGNITATTGNITAPSGDISASGTLTAGTGITATTGDIQATIGKVKTARIESVVDTDPNTTALAIGPNVINGNIVIGASLATGDVSIATAHTSGGTITLGSVSTETTINGIINIRNDTDTGSSILSGNLGFVSINSAYTVPAPINTRFFIRVSGGTPTITLPTPIAGQYITIRSITNGAVTIVPPSTLLLSIYIIGSNAGVSTYSLPTAGTITFYCPTVSQFLQI